MMGHEAGLCSLQLAVLDAGGEHEYHHSRSMNRLKGNPMRALFLASTAAQVTRWLPASERAFGTGWHSRSSRRDWPRGPSCFCRGVSVLKALIAQHLIWRLKTAMETHSYLKYVFSSFLGRREEKLVSKKLLQVHNSASEPRSSFHLSSRSDRSPVPMASSIQTLLCSLWKTLTQSRHLISYPNKSQPGQKRA